MRSFASVGVFALLLCIQCGPASGQEQQTIVITNQSGHTMSYRFRAIYNDGNGSDRRYFTVKHDAGKSLRLTAAGVPHYGILVRLPDGTARSLYASQGPYHIRVAHNPFNTKVFYDVLDAKGKNVPQSQSPY